MRLYFFRHSLKQADGSISPEGFALAESVGARHLRGTCIDLAVGSHQPRTLQTMGALLRGSGGVHSVDRMLEEDCLDSPNVRQWIDYIQETEGNLDPGHPFVAAEAKRMKSEFSLLMSDFAELTEDPDAQCLFVGHAGTLETLIEKITGVMLKPLRECEGAIVDYVDGKFALVEELRRQ